MLQVRSWRQARFRVHLEVYANTNEEKLSRSHVSALLLRSLIRSGRFPSLYQPFMTADQGPNISRWSEAVLLIVIFQLDV